MRVSELNQVVLKTLKMSVVNHSDINTKPLDVEINHSIRKFKIYAFNATNPELENKHNEYKIVLAYPGQTTGLKGYFDFDKEYFVILLGYIKELDCFVLWDAILHDGYSCNKSVQYKSNLIYSAIVKGIDIVERTTKKGIERIIGCRSDKLIQALELRYKLYLND